jgi:putative multiple sugar transport system permease protein
MLVKWGIHYAIVVPLCLILGGLIGAAQGYWIAYQKIPAFIVTLAGMLVFRGLTYVVLSNRPIGPFPRTSRCCRPALCPTSCPFGGSATSLIKNWTALVVVVVAGRAGSIYGFRSRASNERHGTENEPLFFALQMGITSIVAIFLGFQLSTYKGLPNVLVVMAVLIVFYTFITTRSTIGRRIYAMGGNEKAAKLSGINTERLTFFTFVNMGVLAALAGMIIAARLNSATPKAGVGFELDVIAACFIGGASASGGVGKITGAVIGAFIMGVMNNGMSIMGLGIDYQQLVKGLVLLAAVYFDVYNKKKGLRTNPSLPSHPGKRPPIQ